MKMKKAQANGKIALTKEGYWDRYWEQQELPSIVSKNDKEPLVREIIKCFEAFLPACEAKTMLEIGGAPGQYLAYFYRNHGYSVYCIDYSEAGCMKTEENFRLLGVKGTILMQNISNGISAELPKVDIVYSLGLIEHFSKPEVVVEKHLEFLKSGGLLIIGLPNLRGIYFSMLKVLAPEILKHHNTGIMDLNQLDGIAKKYKLQTLFKGYIAGFEPRVLYKRQKENWVSSLALFTVRMLILFSPLINQLVRRKQSKYVSAYIMAVFRKQ